MKNPWKCAVLGLLLSSHLVFAQDSNQLSGTLLTIHQRGTVLLGVRAASIPFSYTNSKGQPIGYSIDLCRAIVDEIGKELNGITPDIHYIPVTASNRIDALLQGKIDLECGSTTSNAERQKQVAFSPLIFISGTKVLVRKHSDIKTFRDLKNKHIITTTGTTNTAAMQQLNQQFNLGMQLSEAPDHDRSYATLMNSQADAFASDDVLLAGLLATYHSKGQFTIIGDYLSYDPYGIMLRAKDPAMSALVLHTLRQLAETGELEHIYTRWFLEPLPGGEQLNLPMSQQLRESFQILGMPE